MVPKQFAERPTQPLGKRQCKAHFGAVQQLRWQAVAQGADQNVFALAIANFPLVRNLCGDVSEFMVEHRRADFERRSHRHAVDLHQHVTRKFGSGLEIQSLGQWIGLTREKAIGENLFQMGGIGRRHPVRPKEFAAHQSGCIITLEVALGRCGAADHVKVILAARGVWEPVRDGGDHRSKRFWQGIVALQILHDLKALVAAEKLVAAVAAQRDFHMLRRELRNDVGRDGRGISKWFVKLAHQFLGKVDGVGFDDDFVVFRLVLLRNSSRERQLIEGRFFESDRKCLHRLRRLKSHGRHNGARIDAAAQERPKRNIRDHSNPDGFVELLSNFPAGVVHRKPGGRRGGRRWISPVPALSHGSIGAIFQPASRFQFPNRSINRKRIWNIRELKIKPQRFGIDFQRNFGGAKAFQFATEIKSAWQIGIIKRFFAETVPDQQHFAGLGVPNTKRKHSPQAVQTFHAFLLVQMDQDLCIAVGPKLVPLRDQAIAKFFIFVNFSVKDHPNGTIFVRNGLMSGSKINDAQPPHPDPTRALYVKPFIVRTTVPNDIAHRLHNSLARFAVPLKITCYAAHSAGIPLTPCYCECRPVRSAREIRFRLWQQFENLRLLVFPPTLSPNAPVADLPLPGPKPVAAAFRGSAYALEVDRIAKEVVAHRLPLFGFQVDTGPQIKWRKDYISGQVTGTDYFRLIPYLDFSKAGDHKVIWEINRHQHLVLLAQAWLITNQAAYLDELQAELKSWFAQNPFLRGINYSSALEVAFRALSWLWLDHLAGAALHPEIRKQLVNNLFQHGHFLQANLSTYFSPNTHLLGEGVALHALGLKFPSTGWEKLGNEILAEERDRQIQSDGSHFEQSTYYHVYALDLFLFYYLVAGKPSEFAAPIRNMASFLASVNGPAGLLNFFGDDDGGRLFHPFGDRAAFGRATLSTCARLFPDAGLPFYDSAAAEQADWWLGINVAVTGTKSADCAMRFPDSGLVSISRGELHLLIDTGPFGPGGAGHSHSDTLSFTVRIGDRELLIDPGTFTYVADPKARDEFRGSGYHNTIRVDGQDQADPTRPFRWDNKPQVTGAPIREEGEKIYLDATCRYRDISHRRRFTVVGSRVLYILDQLTGPEGEHLIEQFWHKGSPVTIHSDAPVQPERLEGWRSRCLGSKEKSEVSVYRWRATFPVTVRSAIVFEDHSATPDWAEAEFPAV